MEREGGEGRGRNQKKEKERGEGRRRLPCEIHELDMLAVLVVASSSSRPRRHHLRPLATCFPSFRYSIRKEEKKEKRKRRGKRRRRRQVKRVCGENIEVKTETEEEKE